jgi:hypothetical protein
VTIRCGATPPSTRSTSVATVLSPQSNRIAARHIGSLVIGDKILGQSAAKGRPRVRTPSPGPVFPLTAPHPVSCVPIDDGLVLEGDDLDLLGHREHDVEWRLRSRLFHRRQPAARYCRPTAASEADRSWMALHQDQGPLMVVVRGGFLSRRVARFVWAWAEAAAIGMQIDVGLKIRRHLVTLGLGQCYVVWSRRRGGRRESRETAALRLGTAGRVGNRRRRTGTGGIRRPPGTACWRNSPA